MERLWLMPILGRDPRRPDLLRPVLPRVTAVPSVTLPCASVPQINSEAFLAEEDGDLRHQRVLLRDVSAEAAQAFLHYLYAADTVLTPQLAADLRSLAQRSGLFFPLTSRFLTVTDRDYLVDGP